MANSLKSRKNYTKSVLKKMTEDVIEVANMVMVSGLMQKTVEGIKNAHLKLEGMAQVHMFIGNEIAVMALSRLTNKLQFLEDNEVKRTQVWEALATEIQELDTVPPEE